MWNKMLCKCNTSREYVVVLHIEWASTSSLSPSMALRRSPRARCVGHTTIVLVLEMTSDAECHDADEEGHAEGNAHGHQDTPRGLAERLALKTQDWNADVQGVVSMWDNIYRINVTESRIDNKTIANNELGCRRLERPFIWVYGFVL